MLSNVLHIETEAMTISFRTREGCIILFDFKAAFPSLSRTILIESLKKIGVGEEGLQAIINMYKDNVTYIKYGSTCSPQFDMTRGVRQGCPLSPLLFALDRRLP